MTKGKADRQRERERERARERERDRERDREYEKESERERERETQGERERETERASEHGEVEAVYLGGSWDLVTTQTWACQATYAASSSSEAKSTYVKPRRGTISRLTSRAAGSF